MAQELHIIVHRYQDMTNSDERNLMDIMTPKFSISVITTQKETPKKCTKFVLSQSINYNFIFKKFFNLFFLVIGYKYTH
jgi:hypothetical protein